MGVIASDWKGVFPVDLVPPETVSPTWKVPEIIEISKSLGTQKSVTLTPSKNAYT